MTPSHVLITGAGSGIGRAIAGLASRAGADLTLLDRDAAALAAAAAGLEGDGQVVDLTCDVGDEAQVDAAFERAVERIGVPDGVVACAGIDRGGDLHTLDAATWDTVIEVNLRGTFLTCRAALRHMVDAGRSGSIVCVSSPFAFAAAPGGSGAYAASKAGISALVRTLAVDYGRHGIRVNALLPGPTETDLMWAGVPPDAVPEMREQVRREVPLGRLADPAEPARAAVWLLSDDASYVTGSQMACDGGVLAKASISV